MGSKRLRHYAIIWRASCSGEAANVTQNFDPTHHTSLPSLPIPLAHMLDRICVRPPYFALQQLHRAGDTLHATAPTELALGFEQAPIGAAEMGRHGAILGLCAAALSQSDDTRRYYLARKANFIGHPVAIAAHEVRFSAQLSYLDKRKAVAQVFVRADDVLLGELSIDYTVLTENAFAWMFRSNQQLGVQTSGYDAELAGTWRYGQDDITFSVPKIPLAVCSGHFDAYPALPVAVLMSYLVRLGGRLVGGPYRSVYGEVKADDLCWAGAGVRFEVERTHCEGDLHHFKGFAISDEIIKGDMTFGLAAV